MNDIDLYMKQQQYMFFEKVAKLTTVSQKVMVKCQQVIPDFLWNGANFLLWTVLKAHQHVHLNKKCRCKC